MPTYERNSGKQTSTAAATTTSSNWTVDDIRKSDILVFRESASEYIDTVVAPNGFQIGLLDETFLSDLLVTGHITGSGIIYAEQAFSGSLQKLVNGNDYLLGGSGIEVTNNADGSITIEAGGEGQITRYKSVVVIGQAYVAGTNVPVSAFAFANESYSHNAIDVFLNGDLLIPGDSGTVSSGDADYYLAADIGTIGQIVFRYDVGTNDELIVTVGGGGAAANVITYSAGNGLSLIGGQYSVDVDNVTVGFNSSAELEVKNMPGIVTLGNGLAGSAGSTFNGSANNTISVNAVSGSPITVTSSGIGLSTAGASVLSLVATDELIISQGGIVGKTTVQDVLDLVSSSSNAPAAAAYLVAASTAGLANERVLTAGNGIAISDAGANSTMTVSALIESSGGLSLATGKLAVQVSDIIGFGLSETGGNIIVDTSAIAGSGLTANVGTSVLDLDFSQVAAASNTISVSAGDGLNAGGSVSIGTGGSINLAVVSEDIRGTGLSVSNNNLDLYIKGAGGITISTGSIDSYGTPITVDGSSFGTISQITAGTGLTGGGTTGNVTLNVANLSIAELSAATLQTAAEVTSDASGFGNNDTSLLTAAAIKTYIDAQNFGVGAGSVTSVGLTAGSLIDITGGPVTASGNIQVDVDLSELTTSTSDGDGDFFVVVDSANAQKKLTKANIDISGFSNDANYLSSVAISNIAASSLLVAGEAFVDDDTSIMTSARINDLIESKGYTTEVGDITSVIAGTGLSGGGNSADVTLNVSNVTIGELHADTVTVSTDSFEDNDTTLMTSAAINDLIVGKGYTTQTGDVTSVVAGSGLATGGTSGDVTVDIDYAGADSVIKSATDGTGITVDTSNDLLLLHDADTNTVKYVKPSQLTSGTAGVIGAAEDGDYTDGLFSSFTSSTPTGTAVDKFNEVLKLLAPPPAPDVNSINTTTSNGMSAKLSFGSTNTGAPTYIDSGTAAGFPIIDTNASYSPSLNGSNERIGIFTVDTTVEGIVNHDTTLAQYANSTINYVADSLGNGELGTLKLYVNGSLLHSTNFASFTGAGNPGSGSATSLGGTSNSSGFYDVSIAKDATSEGGTSFSIFKHRTAKYRVHHTDQREGWNYAQVIHTVGSSDKTTNFIEWINDTDNTAITATGTAVTNVAGSDEFVLSGIKYFKTASFDYGTTVNNAHRALHTATPIVFNSQYGSITSATDQNSVNLITTFPGVASGQDFTKSIIVSASGTFNVAHLPAAGLLNQGSTLSVNVVHPRTSKNQSGLAATSVPNLLMWSTTSSSTENELEDFNSETYRQQAGNYATQADIYTSSAYVTPWNSATKVNSSDAGHNTGLVLYQGSLKAPTNTLLNGDFASITNGPGSNADYSSITSGTRTYIRSFKKTSAGTVRDVRLSMRGSGTIITNGTSFGNSNNNFKVYIKVPDVTGWMDLATAFTLGNTGDNHGARVSTWQPALASGADRANYASFGLLTIAQNQRILVKIEADATWTGYISKMQMFFGASTGSETSIPDDCSTLDSDQTGVNAKLSFGNASSIPASDADHPYTNVNGAHSGLSTVDLNSSYNSQGSNVGRRGIFDGDTIITGTVNSGESGDSQNFVANVINNGNLGEIKLYANDVLLQTVNLTTFTGVGLPGSGTDTSVTAGSGFTHISTSTNVTWSDGIPDYRYFVRTMNYKVAVAHQRSGHNWVQVIHSHGGTDYPTTYAEWVNDPSDSTTFALAFSGQEIDNFSDGDIAQLSGISYFKSPSSEVRFRISNIYRNIFSDSSSGIGFKSLGSTLDLTSLAINGAGVTNKSGSSDTTSLPNLGTTSADYTLPLDVTGSINHHNTSKALPGTHGNGVTGNVSIVPTVIHPLKNSSGKDDSALTKSNFLIWSPVQSTSLAHASPPLSEDFSGERYRLQDIAYSTVNDITGNTWDPAESLIGNGSGGNAGHNTGLCIYNGYLIPPSAAGNSGNFATGLQGPSGNVNYSIGNVSTTTRTYLRHFYNTNTGDSVGTFTISMTGTGSLKAETGALNQASLGTDTTFYMKIKIVYPASPGTEAAKTTGWLDCGTNIGNYGNTNGDGCSAESNADLNVVWNNNTQAVSILYPTDRGLYGTSSSFSRNYVIIKIETHKEWTGKFTALSITP